MGKDHEITPFAQTQINEAKAWGEELKGQVAQLQEDNRELKAEVARLRESSTRLQQRIGNAKAVLRTALDTL